LNIFLIFFFFFSRYSVERISTLADDELNLFLLQLT
jgi:hypothetical protein